MNSDFEIGDPVMLSPDSQWANCYRNNPVGVIGKVTKSLRREWVRVDWGSDIRNSYKPTDSDLITPPAQTQPVDTTVDIEPTMQSILDTALNSIEELYGLSGEVTFKVKAVSQ